MDQTKRIGLLAAILATAIVAACNGTVNTNTGGSGGCPDAAHCASDCPETPVEGGECSIEGQVCGDLDECGYGMQAVCSGGTWEIDYSDPGPDDCGCGVPCMQQCPATEPVSGSACDGEGTSCTYPDPSCNEGGTEATCSGGVWSVDYFGPDCLPTCPATPPVAGMPCDGCCLAKDCSYLGTSGCPEHFTCEGGVWTVDVAMCTPASTCSSLSMTECFDTNGCRWLTNPWCGGLPEDFPQGCYPITDCASSAECSPGETCKQVDVDPCPGGDCGECSKQVAICAP